MPGIPGMAGIPIGAGPAAGLAIGPGGVGVGALAGWDAGPAGIADAPPIRGGGGGTGFWACGGGGGTE
jgi:hypothetical protein